MEVCPARSPFVIKLTVVESGFIGSAVMWSFPRKGDVNYVETILACRFGKAALKPVPGLGSR